MIEVAEEGLLAAMAPRVEKLSSTVEECSVGDVLANDVEQGWEQMTPFFLHENNAYGAWQAQDDIASPYHMVDNVEELRLTNAYAVLTPKEYVSDLKAAPFHFATFHPFCGGMPLDLAWSSLRLFEHEVLPVLSSSEEGSRPTSQ